MTRARGRIGRTGRAMLLAATGTLLLTGVVRAASPAPNVVVLPTTGVVDQVMAGYLADGIASAEADGAAAVIIELDTPGGDLFSTNDIVGSELDATIPVIVWVAPAGGFAASAGTFITLASNIAVMAPGTSIGAASPVGSGGTDIAGTEGQKVTNDAAAKIQSIAETRGRNVDWARSTVLQAASASATQAVSLKAVDGIAATLPDVLAFANGRTVTVGGGASVTLNLDGATTTEIDMGPIQVLLHLLNDPNIAFVLFIIGGLGLVGELFHPNFFTGTVGAIALVLAFIGFGSLPLNIAGLILIALAIALFVAEAFVPSHALLAAGGLVCLVIGGGTLYAAPGSPTAPDVSVALPVLVAVVIGAALYLLVVISAATRVRTLRGSPGTVGHGLAPGLQGEVRRPLDPEGSVYLGGEEWSARTTDQRPLPRGTPVRVIRQEGLVVLVEPLEAHAG